MEAEVLLPCTQEPDTGAYRKPDIWSPQLYFPTIVSNIIFPSTSRSCEWSHPLRLSDQNFVCIFQSLPCVCVSDVYKLHLFTFFPRLLCSPAGALVTECW